jgi:hypothetical protein
LYESYLGAVAVAEEEVGVDGSGGDRQSTASTAAATTNRVESGRDLESGGDLENFRMKSERTLGRVLFIGSKISVAVLI